MDISPPVLILAPSVGGIWFSANDRHVGLGMKCSKEVAGAIRGAIINAKLSIIPVRRGYWGSHIAEPHTVPMKVSGKAGSVMCRLIPARTSSPLAGLLSSARILIYSPRYRYRCRPRFQKDVADGWYPGLLQYVPFFTFSVRTDRQPNPRDRPLPRVTS
jgi:hypothetical protein